MSGLCKRIMGLRVFIERGNLFGKRGLKVWTCWGCGKDVLVARFLWGKTNVLIHDVEVM